MKKSILATLLLSALIITSCGKPASSEEAPGGKPSSEPTSQSTSSVEPTSESSRSTSSSDSKGSSSSSSTTSTPSSSSSSSSSSAPVEPAYFENDISVSLEPSLVKSDDGHVAPYNLEFHYSDELLLGDAKEYNPDLSMLSFLGSISTANENSVTSFYFDMGFEDISKFDISMEPTKDTMGRVFAHKVIDDYEVVAVALRGFNYGLEWTNNFTIGAFGDHEGFNARADEIYRQLAIYIENTIDGAKTLKLWINGYSRGGSVANALAHFIMTGDRFDIAQEDLSVYTFEAPAPLYVENAPEYKNVHNIMNEGDLIANIMPESYELRRCGVDYEIYDENVSALMKEFDDKIDFPEFNLPENNSTGATNDIELRDYILNSVFNSSSSDETAIANTREQYVNNYQEGLSNAIGYIFALKPATRSEVLAALQGLGFGAISIIGDASGQALADFIKPYLDKDQITYVETELVANCAVLVKGIGTLFLQLLMMFISNDYKPSLTRLIDFHYPEVTYVLLKNAHSQSELVIEG